MTLHEQFDAQISELLARYPSKRSAVLPMLYLAQDAYGHLTDPAIREVAAILGLPATDVFEVVGFYSLFYNRPVGTWMLQVCDDVPCCYLGAEELITALKQSLGISEEQTTADGMFTLQRVKCLAACDRAPVVQANLDYLYDVQAAHADALLRNLRARAAEAKQRGVSGRFAEDYLVQADGALTRTAAGEAFQARWNVPTAIAPVAPVAPVAEPAAPESAPAAPESAPEAEAAEKPEAKRHSPL